MKIILTITDSNGKNIAFVTDNHQTLTLEEGISAVRNNEIKGVHIVESKNGTYLRANPNSKIADNLDFESFSLITLINYLKSKAKNNLAKTYDWWWAKAKKDINNNIGVIGTLYSQGLKKPHLNPEASDRGLQIQNEFCPLVKRIMEK
ncbi:DUF3892 domain-containing protein [Thermoproteota archaeon]